MSDPVAVPLAVPPAGAAALDALRDTHHPRCFVHRPPDDFGLGVTFAATADAAVEAAVACPASWEGYPGLVHGGIIAALLDGAMTNALFARGTVALTAEVALRYRRPCPGHSRPRRRRGDALRAPSTSWRGVSRRAVPCTPPARASSCGATHAEGNPHAAGRTPGAKPTCPYTPRGESPDWTERASSWDGEGSHLALPEGHAHARDDPLPAERPGHARSRPTGPANCSGFCAPISGSPGPSTGAASAMRRVHRAGERQPRPLLPVPRVEHPGRRRPHHRGAGRRRQPPSAPGGVRRARRASSAATALPG